MAVFDTFSWWLRHAVLVVRQLRGLFLSSSTSTAIVSPEVHLSVSVEAFFVFYYQELLIVFGLTVGLLCGTCFVSGVLVGKWIARPQARALAAHAQGLRQDVPATPRVGVRRHSTPPAFAPSPAASSQRRSPVRRTLSFHDASPSNQFPVPLVEQRAAPRA